MAVTSSALARSEGPLVIDIVVGVFAGHMADGGLGLDLNEVLVVLDVECRPGGVDHLPVDDCGDLDRVAHGVIDLEYVRIEGADPQRDLLFAGERD